MSSPRIDDATRQRVLDLAEQGVSRNQIARDLQISAGSVTNIIRAAGKTNAFDRSRTENATRARVVDLAARRASIAETMLDLADRFAARARESYTVYLATKDDVHPVTYDEPPLGEVRQAMTALGIAVDKHMALIRFDTKEAGNAGALSLVDRLAAAFDLDNPDADDGYPTPEPPRDHAEQLPEQTAPPVVEASP
ncbi:MAG: hypothetical protein EPO06_11660 [Burkholderiaceae bacterium]|nr:MAG: hypothetical protein EPO06_11660 [Burkholderiaceae bacterium]